MKFLNFILKVHLIIICLTNLVFTADITTPGTGIKLNWSNTDAWVGGVIPTSTDNVTIVEGDTVTIDVNASCHNLLVSGRLDFNSVTSVNFTVTGDVLISSNGNFRTNSVTSGPLLHYITIHGNLTNQGTFDMRVGSNPNVGVGEITFTGSSNSLITMGAYSSSNNEFNSITINKSGGAKVILGSDVSTNNNSTTAPAVINLVNGIIETGNYALHARSTSASTGIQGGSNTSYVNGTLIRYMATGSNLSRVFPIGDEDGYRPITVYILTGAANSPISARVIKGNANTGSSTFVGGIDKVSAVRYYEVKNLHSAAFDFTSFSISYGADDGVAIGNKELRIATSTDSRATWINRGPDSTGSRAHLTTLTSPPTVFRSDTIAPNINLAQNQVVYLALAKTTGSVNNTLEPVILGSISGTKYFDVEGDSSISGNLGSSGWVIKLYKDGILQKRTITNASGYYIINDLYPGTYTVEESLKTGWIQTYPPVGLPGVVLTTYGPNAGPRAYSITINNGSDVNNVDFGNYRLPSISGRKYFDADADSSIIDDTPLHGFVIKLYKDGILQQRTVTNVNGEYIFANVPNGTYTIEESLKANWYQTYPRLNDPGVTNTTYGTNAGPRAYIVEISSGVDIINKDFGNRSLNPPGTIRSAGVKGNWSQPTTWEGGEVPSAVDNVVIINGDTVYYDVPSGGVKNLTIGENANVPTMLFIKNDANYSLTVFGDINVNGDSARFYCQSGASSPLNHNLILKGNLISTGTIDFKTGTSPNNSLLTLILDGNKNSILQVKPFIVEPATVNEFHSITINKTDGARVILQSDIGMANLSTSILSLTNGIVETGPYTLGVFSTASGSIVGGSQSSYVYGKLARGWASSGTVNNKLYPIGDSLKYRPVWVSNTNSNYHLLTVEVVSGNSNIGNSVLFGNIDKVSKIRYYKAKASLIPRIGTVPSPFYLTRAGIGYYADDGVASGNTNLRVAVSFDHRQTWTGYGPTTHTTSIASTPTQILSADFEQIVELDSSFYFALARVTGTTENRLELITNVNVNVSTGWNLISVPLLVDTMTKSYLFPTSKSAAFHFENGYQSTENLINGKGYWLKFAENENIPISGVISPYNTINVSAGWNLIGVFDVSVNTNQIITNPNGIIVSQFYGYNNGYVATTTLMPGKGYWVKVSQAGTLTLPTSSMKQNNVSRDFEDSKWGKIIIEDANGNSKILYASAINDNLMFYELPPLPPDGAFDVRFSTNRYVENLVSPKDLLIKTTSYPIKLKVKDIELCVKDQFNGKIINETLKDGNEIIIDDERIYCLNVVIAQLPEKFALYQNSPNPFNSSTVIKYSLPQPSKVVLKIYSIIGNEIATLVNEIKQAGEYVTQWNGLNDEGVPVASGIYFCKILAEPISQDQSFMKVNKMLLLK